MRSNRPPGAARKPVPAAGTGALRGLRPGAGVARAVSVTALAAVACAMWAAPAGAAVKHASKTRVSAKPTTAYVRASVKLSATVKSSGRVPTGTVTFWSGTRKLCAGHLSKASTSCAARFVTAAMKTVIGKYSGDARHKASSGTVHVMIMNKPAAGKFRTTTHITAPNPIATQASGLPYAVKVTVTSAGGGAPTGTVLVAPTNLTNPGPTYSCSFTLTAAMNGSGSCNVTPPKGAYGFTLFQATYSGNATHNGSATPVAEEHKLINPDSTATTVGPASAPAGEVTLTATVVPGGGGNILAGFSETGGDTVAFTIGGTTIAGCGAVALTWNGTVNVAQCTTTLGAGTYDNVQAAYSGDEYTFPSQGTETLTVS
jgi:Bacterial Ig-like domain (group 3)